MSETTSTSLPHITTSSTSSNSFSSQSEFSSNSSSTESPLTAVYLPSLTTSTSITTSSSSSSSYSSVTVKVPSQEATSKNPFIYHSNFKEGTLFLIVLPILGYLFLLYILSVAWFRWRSKRHAKDVESRDDFDDDYTNGFLNYEDNNSNMFKGSETASMFTGSGSSNPFSTTNPGNTSEKDGFVKKHMKRFSASLGVELDNTPIETEFSKTEMTMLQHQKNNYVDLLKEDPSLYHGVYQTDVTQFQSYNDDFYGNQYGNPSQPTFQLNSTNEYVPTTPGGLGAAPIMGSPTLSTAAFLPEPEKAKSQTTVNKPNTKTHFHKKTLSSLALDEFISTGQLPNYQVERVNTSTLDPFIIGNDTTNDMSLGNNSIVIFNEPERHSMYENTNLSYSSLNSTPVRLGHNRSRSVSPVRKDNQTPRGHVSRDSFSRGGSRSPVRGGSPIRNEAFKTPTKRKLFFHQQDEVTKY